MMTDNDRCTHVHYRHSVVLWDSMVDHDSNHTANFPLALAVAPKPARRESPQSFRWSEFVEPQSASQPADQSPAVSIWQGSQGYHVR